MSAHRLKLYRSHAGLTQRALGEVLGLHSTEIANYETGKRLPSLKIAVRIEEITASWPLGPIRTHEWVRTGKAAS